MQDIEIQLYLCIAAIIIAVLFGSLCLLNPRFNFLGHILIVVYFIFLEYNYNYISEVKFRVTFIEQLFLNLVLIYSYFNRKRALYIDLPLTIFIFLNLTPNAMCFQFISSGCGIDEHESLPMIIHTLLFIPLFVYLYAGLEKSK